MKIKGRRRGYALITIIALTGLFLTIAGAVGSEVLAGLHNTRVRKSGSTARYAAYAGIQHAVHALRDPNTDPENLDLTKILMPGSDTVSYSVYITVGDSAGTAVADDGTVVPEGTIYCVAVGVDGSSSGGDVALHAMSGVISDGRPTLKYAAYADQSLKIEGAVQSLSVDSTTDFNFEPAQLNSNTLAINASDPMMARVTPSTTGSLGDLGTNRYLDIGSGVNISGKIHRPPGLALAANLPNVVDLDHPEDIPRYSSPAGSQNAQSPPPVIPSPGQGTAVYTKLEVASGSQAVLQPGRYFFRDGMDIAGVLNSSGDDPDEPVVLFLGGDATLADTARVNLGKSAANIQIYFVDDGGETPLKFKMDGNSQFFGTVVGNRAEGELGGQAEFYGGFLGRSMSASGSAKLVYDQTLDGKPLGVAANWGLNGITEPKPEKVLQISAAAKMYVQSVRNNTVHYKAPIGVAQKAMPSYAQ